MTVKTCYRGHKITGANIQVAGKRQRCKACRRANENTLRKPELRADIDRIADEAYHNLMNGITPPRREKKPAAAPARPKQQQPRVDKYLNPIPRQPSVDEVLRRMPNGCKRYIHDADTPVDEWPQVIIDYLYKYDLARDSKRPRNGNRIILTKRGGEVKRRLTEKLRGR